MFMSMSLRNTKYISQVLEIRKRVSGSGYIATFAVIVLLACAMSFNQVGAVQLFDSEHDKTIIKTSTHAPLAGTSSDTVIAEGVFFEKTSIIKFTNNSDEMVKSFTLWLGSGYTFESFKTEKGWTAKKTPQGTIMLTTSGQLNTGESVKFGVKTNKAIPAISWSAADNSGREIKVGRTVMEIPEEPVPVHEEVEDPETPAGGILAESKFRIIPEKPKVGSTIRVVGESFAASQQFSFYMDVQKLGVFLTDENGNFITTIKIPDEQDADRVSFRVIDAEGDEKQISLRLSEVEDRIHDTNDVKLTIQGLPSVLHRGDVLEISGTAKPGSTVIASIRNSDDVELFTRTAVVDLRGDWRLEKAEIIPLDAELGKYSVKISDGEESIFRTWEVESSKVIIIEPANLKYELGDTIVYKGTAQPNKSIELVLEDPIGKMVASDIIMIDSSGNVEFEYKTDNDSAKGTYTLIATQDNNKEFVFVGLGQLPDIPVNLEFDKLNYRSGETAIISLTGKPSDIVSLLVINPAGRAIPLVESEEIAGDGKVIVRSNDSEGGTVFLKLRSDGRGTYSIDLDRYNSGAYTAVLSKGTAKSTETFTVGLEMGGEIKEVHTTKKDYAPGDSILVLGETNPNTFITISLNDPDGEQIRIRETFSYSDGRISDSSFKIPSDAKSGQWTIIVKSGNNSEEAKINVANSQQGIAITATKETLGQGLGEALRIQVTGAVKHQSVIIYITSQNEDVIQKLEFPATTGGEINQPWIIPRDIEPGTYTIKVEQMKTSAQTTYRIE